MAQDYGYYTLLNLVFPYIGGGWSWGKLIISEKDKGMKPIFCYLNAHWSHSSITYNREIIFKQIYLTKYGLPNSMLYLLLLENNSNLKRVCWL